MAFFALVLGGNSFAPILGNLGLTPLMAAVLVGAAQNVFSKSAKYSLFDPCKEMAYIPLDRDTQVGAGDEASGSGADSGLHGWDWCSSASSSSAAGCWFIGPLPLARPLHCHVEIEHQPC